MSNLLLIIIIILIINNLVFTPPQCIMKNKEHFIAINTYQKVFNPTNIDYYKL